MSDNELREIHRHSQEQRRKELRKHMALVLCAVVVVIAVVAAVIIPKRGKEQDVQSASVTAEAKDSASGRTSGKNEDPAPTEAPALISDQSSSVSETENTDPQQPETAVVTESPVLTDTPAPTEAPILTEAPAPTANIAPATTAAPTEPPVPEETPAPEPVVEIPPGVTYWNTYVPNIDRSTFAVDPNVPCGSDWYPEDEKVVYLTLDDGPSYLTPQFLEVLDRYNVKATFFVTGQNPDYLYLIKEAYDRGHTIGLHTYTHDYASVYASVDSFFNEIYSIGAVVQQQIGYMPCFIRFPGGSTNTISDDYCPGIMDVLRYEVQARGFQYYDWNCSSGDGGSNTNVAELAAQGASSPYATTILLSHDANGKEATLLALPAIIEFYLSYGYEFRPLNRETFTAHQS